MATELKPAADLSLTSFNGGEKRGTCLQLTAPFHRRGQHSDEGFVNIRQDQAVELALALLEFAHGARPTLY